MKRPYGNYNHLMLDEHIPVQEYEPFPWVPYLCLLLLIIAVCPVIAMGIKAM